MRWSRSWRCDPVARKIADRHYNRQSVGARDFVPPGRCLVLWMPGALWVTSWPFARYVKHGWPGAWMCSAYRREAECPHLSSEIIREAVAATRANFADVPALGMVTFVDAGKTRQKRDPGYCFRMAGFRHVGFTAAGLWAFQMLPAEMPQPDHALGSQGALALEVA